MRLWKLFAGCLGIIFLFSNFSAIIISEVELNPPGKDVGNEWVEFYSEDYVSLGGYTILNNDGGVIELSGNFSGIFVYEFGGQWLDNSDEKILLYKGGELVDETEILDDSNNDDFSWIYCSGWKFKEGSKGEDNNCDGEEEKKGEIRIGIEEVTSEESTVEETISVESKDDNTETTITGEAIIEEDVGDDEKVIYLNSKSIKSQNDIDVLFKSRGEIIKNYAIYVFALFCVIIIYILLIDRK